MSDHPAACPYCRGRIVNQVHPDYLLRPARLNDDGSITVGNSDQGSDFDGPALLFCHTCSSTYVQPATVTEHYDDNLTDELSGTTAVTSPCKGQPGYIGRGIRWIAVPDGAAAEVITPEPPMWTHEFHVPFDHIPHPSLRPGQEWLRDTLDAAGFKGQYTEATAFVTNPGNSHWIITIESTETVLRFCNVLFNQHVVGRQGQDVAAYGLPREGVSAISAYESERLEATLAGPVVPICPNCKASAHWSADVDVTNRAKVNLSGSVLIDRAQPEGSSISKAGAFICDACGLVVDDTSDLYERLWPLAQEVVASPEPGEQRRWRVIYSYTEV